MPTNLDRLLSAGVIANPHRLSEAETQVISALSDAEVRTLIGIRKKLAHSVADGGPDEFDPLASNLIV